MFQARTGAASGGGVPSKTGGVFRFAYLLAFVQILFAPVFLTIFGEGRAIDSIAYGLV